MPRLCGRVCSRRRALPPRTERDHVCPASAAFDTVPISPVRESRRMQLAISQDLLDILVCPECKTPVTLTANGGGLNFCACLRVYSIRRQILLILLEKPTVPAVYRQSIASCSCFSMRT